MREILANWKRPEPSIPGFGERRSSRKDHQPLRYRAIGIQSDGRRGLTARAVGMPRARPPLRSAPRETGRTDESDDIPYGVYRQALHREIDRAQDGVDCVQVRARTATTTRTYGWVMAGTTSEWRFRSTSTAKSIHWQSCSNLKASCGYLSDEGGSKCRSETKLRPATSQGNLARPRNDCPSQSPLRRGTRASRGCRERSARPTGLAQAEPSGHRIGQGIERR